MVILRFLLNGLVILKLPSDSHCRSQEVSFSFTMTLHLSNWFLLTETVVEWVPNVSSLLHLFYPAGHNFAITSNFSVFGVTLSCLGGVELRPFMGGEPVCSRDGRECAVCFRDGREFSVCSVWLWSRMTELRLSFISSWDLHLSAISGYNYLDSLVFNLSMTIEAIWWEMTCYEKDRNEWPEWKTSRIELQKNTRFEQSEISCCVPL